MTRVGRYACALGRFLRSWSWAVSPRHCSPPQPGSPPSTTSTTVSTSTVTTSPASSVLVFSGHGWGHGLGLSQWGAYGYAKHGWTFDRILAHYYTGTTLGPAKVSTVRVLLASAKTATINSTARVERRRFGRHEARARPGHARAQGEQLAIADHPELAPPFTFVGQQPLLVTARRLSRED